MPPAQIAPVYRRPAVGSKPPLRNTAQITGICHELPARPSFLLQILKRAAQPPQAAFLLAQEFGFGGILARPLQQPVADSHGRQVAPLRIGQAGAVVGRGEEPQFD